MSQNSALAVGECQWPRRDELPAMPQLPDGYWPNVDGPNGEWPNADWPASAVRAGCQLGHSPLSVRAARHFTSSTLDQWGYSGVPGAAEMVISELVTNAVRYGVPCGGAPHGQTPIGLWLLGETGELMCMVTDPGSEIPVPRESGPFSENGRGLHVVSAYSRRWGWNLLEEGGKAVWALLRIEKLWCAYRKVILTPAVLARTWSGNLAARTSRHYARCVPRDALGTSQG